MTTMSSTPPVIVSRRRGLMECEVPAVSDWEGIEKLARFLEKHYGARVLERIDGPDARRWTLAVRGVSIELQHEDPWGNLIVAPSRSSESILKEIADDLRSRLISLDAHGFTKLVAEPIG